MNAHRSHDGQLNRRSLLALAGAGTLGGLSALFCVENAVAQRVTAAATPAVATRDYSTKATYDWFVDSLAPVASLPNRSPADENGFWTWYQSAVMRTYPMAYRKWGEPKYLDKLIVDADLLLSERDSVRGVQDWRGLSLPAWRHAYDYTAGSTTTTGDVLDTAGQPLLRLRIGVTGPRDRRRGTATITADATPGRFTIVGVRHSGETTTFANLTMDPTSPDYVVTRLYWADPNVNRLTALDLRDTPTAGHQPAPGDYTMTADYTYGLVDTALLVQPLADFANTVLTDYRLRRSVMSRRRAGEALMTYADKADEYISAAEDALAIHDGTWRDNSQGEGWYVIPPEHPSVWAGSDMPHNQNLAMAKAYLQLADATGNSAYLDRSEMLYRRFKNDLTSEDLPGATTAFVWYYNHPEGLFFNGWTRDDHISNRIPYSNGHKAIEDTSHSTIDIAAVVLAAKHGLIFNAGDMQRFARTFNEKIVSITAAGDIRIWSNVNGTGTLGGQDNVAGPWARLQPWNQQTYDTALEIYNRDQVLVSRGHTAESVGILATLDV